MKTLKLFEVLEALQTGNAVELEIIQQYIKSLNTYFQGSHNEGLIIWCASMNNNSSYWLISPESNLIKDMFIYFDTDDIEDSSIDTALCYAYPIDQFIKSIERRAEK